MTRWRSKMQKQQPLTAILKHSQNIKLKSFQTHSRGKNRCRRKQNWQSCHCQHRDRFYKEDCFKCFLSQQSRVGFVVSSLIQKIDCYRRKCSCCLLFGASFSKKRDARGSLQRCSLKATCFVLTALSVHPGKHSKPDNVHVVRTVWQIKTATYYLRCQNSV